MFISVAYVEASQFRIEILSILLLDNKLQLQIGNIFTIYQYNSHNIYLSIYIYIYIYICVCVCVCECVCVCVLILVFDSTYVNFENRNGVFCNELQTLS